MDEEQELILLCGELLETPALLERSDEQKSILLLSTCGSTSA